MKKEAHPEPVEQRVLQFISKNNLIKAESPLVVAVSGGPDSVCLLHILFELRDKLGAKLHAAHLDHQLRGAESEADAAYVSRLAKQLDLPITVGARDVKGYRARHHISLEEAAREVRYDFLSEVAESIGAHEVAVGHTSDDQAETILMHLIRGTGTRGLRGLQPLSRWRPGEHNPVVIRPLLTVSRQETADYCRRYNLEPRLDTSNLSLSPLRNKIRHQLLPLLESYNPRIKEALMRTARLAEDDLASLNQESLWLGNGLVQKRGEAILFNIRKYLALPIGMQRHLLRGAIEGLLGNLKDVESRHIEEIRQAVNKPAGKTLSLPLGLVFTTEYGQFLLAADSAALSPIPVIKGESSLKIPGETIFSGWRIKATIIKPKRLTGTENDFVAYLSLDAVGNNLLVRSRRPGDKFRPLGMTQPKELTEFMIDAKIPRAWRQRIPIVCSPERIVWVVGWRIDEQAKVTEDTRRILRLKFEQR